MHYELDKVQVIDSDNLLSKFDPNNNDYYTNKYFRVLFNDGVNIIDDFLKLNNMRDLIVKVEPKCKSFRGCCGWYEFDTDVIHIIIEKCARLNPMYSYPNFTSNRTPQGVLLHEFGHFLTSPKNKPYKYTNAFIKRKINENCITSYAPNANEWIAEMLKLYLSNPDLLKHIRPNTYNEFINYWAPLDRGNYINLLKYPLGFVPDKIQSRLNSKLNNI